MLLLLSLFYEIEEGIVPTSFHEVNINLIPKLDKDNNNKNNYKSIPFMNIETKILKKKISK